MIFYGRLMQTFKWVTEKIMYQEIFNRQNVNLKRNDRWEVFYLLLINLKIKYERIRSKDGEMKADKIWLNEIETENLIEETCRVCCVCRMWHVR